MHRICLLWPIVLSAFACTTEVDCAPSNAPAIQLRPVDASSSAPLASVATGTAGFSAYLDTLERGPTIYVGPDSLAGGFRSGSYTIHVEAPDHAPFDTTGVVVPLSAGECPALVTQRFTARLVAIP